MIATLTRVLNLRPGDLRRGWPFFAYLFLVIASYVGNQAYSNGLFLKQFKPDQLPYVDMTIAALVGVVISLYLRASRRTGLRNLLVISLLFLSANAFGFWWSAHYFKWRWMVPILY